MADKPDPQKSSKARRAKLFKKRLARQRRPLPLGTIQSMNASAVERAGLPSPQAHYVGNDIILSMTTEILKSREL